MGQNGELQDFLKFELTPEPTSVFKDLCEESRQSKLGGCTNERVENNPHWMVELYFTKSGRINLGLTMMLSICIING